MLTSILAGLSSFAGGILSGFGLQSLATAVTTAGVGKVAATGTLLVFSKHLGKLFSFVIRWFMIFLIGMFLYRHIKWFHDFVNAICLFFETYFPIVITNTKSIFQH